jgi:hypothetical protein
MTRQDILINFSFHSQANEDCDDCRWDDYFLGSIRPYKSYTSVINNLQKIVSDLRFVSDWIRSSESLPKSFVNDVSGIIYFGKEWAVEDESMLKRNNLITTEELMDLRKWLSCLEYIWVMLLDGQNDDIAFEVYEQLT